MKLEKFTGPGSTPARRSFWDSVADIVIASQKREGKNVSVREDDTGSLISVNPQRQGQATTTTCPPSNPCTLDFTVSTTHWGGTTQTGLGVADGTCQDAGQPTGWRSNNWASGGCIDPGCTFGDNSGCNDTPSACKCGSFGRWRDSSTGANVQIKLDFIQGDSTVTPDGWWLLVGVVDPFPGACFYGGCGASGMPYGTYLGADESIFATDLSISLTLPGRFGCAGDSSSFDITFHPC